MLSLFSVPCETGWGGVLYALLEAVAEQIARANQLTARIYEIKAMDKSALSFSEKKALRKEVRAMKKEIKEGNGGVYLSIGAIIIIILLLILIL